MQAIAIQQLLPGLRCVGRGPVRNDVVDRFVGGSHFHQLYRAFAPALRVPRFRFDPRTGSEMVEGAIILIVIKVAVSLQKAKSPRILIEKRIEANVGAVLQGTPYPFPIARVL